MVKFRFNFSALVLCLLMVSGFAMSAEELVYDNSNLTGYYYKPGVNVETMDYGRSDGGNITRFIFAYYAESNYSANVRVRFYRSTTDSNEGSSLKSFYISGIPHNYGLNYLEYEIPESQQFNLPYGAFGYSFSFSRNDYGPAFAKGGYGSDTFIWEYNELYQDLWLTNFGTIWGGFYMQVFAGEEEIIPDPNICDVSGHVFYDTNANGTKDSGETGLSDQVIFLDYDRDGIWDINEPNAVTDANGNYLFDDTLADDVTFDVRPILDNDWSVTYPSSGYYYIDPDPNVAYSGRDFGITDVSEITLSGIVTMENNGPVSGVRVELYSGPDAAYPSGIYDTTATDGSYSISVTAPFSGKLVATKSKYDQTSTSVVYSNLSSNATEDIVMEYVFGGGSGTSSSPYLIYTAEDLNMINVPNIASPEDSKLTKHYKQMANIDLAAYTGDSFNMIGDSSDAPFEGVYDGNNKTISNFSYSGSDAIVGLFSRVGSEDAEIKNLTLSNPILVTDSAIQGILTGAFNDGTITNCKIIGGSIQGTYNVGGICGYSRGNIVSCYCSADVTGLEGVGCLCGYKNSGNIYNSVAQGNVTATLLAGGLCGYHGSGDIVECSASGQVNSGNASGGLVGRTFLANIYRSFATGDVVSTGIFVGGLVGWNYSECGIYDCYAVGNVTGDEYVGGLAGANSGTIDRAYSIGAVSYNSWGGGLCGISELAYGCYWDKETSNILTSEGGKSCTTSQMKSPSNYLGWNNGFWKMVTGEYPVLGWQDAPGTIITTDYPARTYSGLGTQADPFVLSDELDLVSMSKRRPDLDKYFKLANDIDMTEILDYYPPVMFSGTLDGCNYSINNLSIDSAIIGNSTNVGILGTNSGIVTNLCVRNIDINNCNRAGAICGENQGDILYCCASGSISGGGDLGGICGYNGMESALIENSYCSVRVSGEDYVGGFCGHNMRSITNCYSTGEVTGTGENVSGFTVEGRVTNCFWDIDTSNISSGERGTGKTTAQMQDIATFIGADWDFVNETFNGTEDIWKMFGYPVFSWHELGLNEFANLSTYWNMADCGSGNICHAADYSGDGAVNIVDLTILAENWLAN